MPLETKSIDLPPAVTGESVSPISEVTPSGICFANYGDNWAYTPFSIASTSPTRLIDTNGLSFISADLSHDPTPAPIREAVASLPHLEGTFDFSKIFKEDLEPVQMAMEAGSPKWTGPAKDGRLYDATIKDALNQVFIVTRPDNMPVTLTGGQICSELLGGFLQEQRANLNRYGSYDNSMTGALELLERSGVIRREGATEQLVDDIPQAKVDVSTQGPLPPINIDQYDHPVAVRAARRAARELRAQEAVVATQSMEPQNDRYNFIAAAARAVSAGNWLPSQTNAEAGD